MTTVQQALSALADWIAASSAPRKTPLGGDTLVGPFAVLVVQDLSLTPAPLQHEDGLPLWLSPDQAPQDLQPLPDAPPTSQDHKAQRLAHLLWKEQDGQFPGVQFIRVASGAETLQQALDREAPGLDLNLTAVAFYPGW